MSPTVHTVYRVMLCSGECCEWEYLGPDRHDVAWWEDKASGRVFNEGSLMYAWQILEPIDR